MPSRETGSLLAAALFAILAVVLFYIREDNDVCCKFVVNDTLPTPTGISEASDKLSSKASKRVNKSPTPPAKKSKPIPQRESKRKGGALPEEVKDEATGLSLPRTKRFSKSELVCLGVGTRAKSIAIAKVNVYSVGLYVDAKPARGALKKFAGAEPSTLKKDASLFKVLGQAGGFTKYLHLVFARVVSAQKVVDALTSVQGVKKDVLARFSSLILDTVGKNIGKGESISLGWEGKDKMVVMVRDKLAGTVTDPALPKAVFDLYVGSDPVSPSAKAAFAEGVPPFLSS